MDAPPQIPDATVRSMLDLGYTPEQIIWALRQDRQELSRRRIAAQEKVIRILLEMPPRTADPG